MKAVNLITTHDFCLYHNIEPTFINSLHEAGLFKITVIDKDTFIPETELQRLEKLISLHHLDINVAGIEAITHLLSRVEKMQDDMLSLKNKLRFYEDEEQ